MAGSSSSIASTSTRSGRRPFFGQVGGWLTFWLTVACATDMTLFGYDQASFSGVVINDNFLQLHDLVGPTKTTLLSTVTAIYDVGCFVGAIAAFSIGERLGRKKTILLGTTIMSIGAILQVSSFSLGQMFVARTILGIGNGINTATAPVWQTETAQAKWRGKLVVIEMIMNIAGFAFCNWINYGLSFAGGALAWRFPLALQFLFIAILYATVPWLPESPRWLLAHGYEDEATEVLACLEAKDQDDPYVLTQRKEIIFSINYERDHAVSWSDLIFHPNSSSAGGEGSTKTIRRLLLGAGTQFIQQFSGINIMSYYLPTVLIQSVGLSESLARLLTACNATQYLIFSCIAIPVVERCGRRFLMLFAVIGQGFAFMIIAILLRFADGTDAGQKIASASVAFFFLYYIFFGIGLQGVPWLYPTEINSLPMRTKGAALGTATNWITNFVIVEITPIGIQSLGWRFWIVFTVFNAAFVPLVYFLYPETANRSLEDLDEYFRNNPSLVVTRDRDAVSAKRPEKYVVREREEVETVRAQSVAMRQLSTSGKTVEERMRVVEDVKALE